MSFISSYSRDLCASQAEEDAEDEAEVGNSSYLLHLFHQILAADAERSFLLGWSDPRLTLATESCAKVGSLQPNTVPSRGHFAHSVVCNFLSFGGLLARRGEREGDEEGDLCLSSTLHHSALQHSLEVS